MRVCISHGITSDGLGPVGLLVVKKKFRGQAEACLSLPTGLAFGGNCALSPTPCYKDELTTWYKVPPTTSSDCHGQNEGMFLSIDISLGYMVSFQR